MVEVSIFQTKKALPQGGFITRNPNVSYLLTAGEKNKESVLIDANLNPQKLEQELKNKQSDLKGVFFTHFHHDHTKNLKTIVSMFPSIKLYVSSRSSEAVKSFGLKNVEFLKDGQTVLLDDLELVCWFTPGHTHDSLCLWVPKHEMLFTGDTLFGGGIGCSDYYNGGNRNVFYSTLQGLLRKLSPQTRIYPGHFSEHYQSSPPYLFSGELTNNPYLVSVSKGKRGEFDDALKEFSVDFEKNDHFMLTESEIDIICDLEKETWIPELRASKETILKRLSLGHKMLALGSRDKLSGMVAWRYDSFSLKDGPDKFPKDFTEYVNQKSLVEPEAKSAFIYNLGVRSSGRKQGVGSALLQYAFEKIRSEGIKQVFVDSRIPSYQGSDHWGFEKFIAENEVAKTVNRSLSQNFVSKKETLLVDPILRFYAANGFSPWLIKNEFIQDKSSGNIRIICYINLEQDESIKLKVYSRN
ncbi:MAG: GNAT family N-acetyltransferase [Candidatus Bathyarchaeota archaeon]|nr:GNAT family N-acetyltransferase [Candidatus Bathyarchaeum sp.]